MKTRKIRAIKHIQGDREIFSLSVQGNEILDIAKQDIKEEEPIHIGNDNKTPGVSNEY